MESLGNSRFFYFFVYSIKIFALKACHMRAAPDPEWFFSRSPEIASSASGRQTRFSRRVILMNKSANQNIGHLNVLCRKLVWTLLERGELTAEMTPSMVIFLKSY